ncbi:MULTISPECIES: DUF2789 domain-containing protein [Pseudoalteromonas]|uniref:DUF2789 domain-containing protein n=1 Tax=Pseudoalteromonas luteoviolacea (strain 2ta16) TaxID=1353533 RepID=V4HUN8_PSEL2|nr:MULTISPECIES: DUF2789 domain-containing protein [Pseudoalteromonas]ESP91634.1 protein of unknown function (DUF2789) [Pseudoalteromonas luteoviolacea 2ta16]KZN35843.1 hypothetical protein N483_23445 [Pseudoalteromonas luteoviolacea NCIMB 1944]MCG7551477.1 DUF2789 domain-containing protein [Pseudoalteromonas sp. Of7M-16]
MDNSYHSLKSLFSQLGLENSDEKISQFIDNNKLPSQTLLVDAPFWNQGQKHFIEESLREDADWSEIIDTLDTLLR